MSQFTQQHIDWANQAVAAGQYPDLKSAVDALCANSGIVADAGVYSQFGIQVPTLAEVAAPAATTATETANTEAPSSLEVPQQALPPGFDLNSALAGRVPSEKSTSRPKNYEVSIEELRSRVTFRDGQPVGQKDATVVWLRPYLSPNTIAVEEINGVQEDGAPKNHWVVPAQFEDAARAEIMKLFASGMYDKQLLAVAEQQRQKDEEKANAPTKAPVDQAAADAALGELAAAAPVQAPAAQELPAAAPATIPSMPAGAPAGVPAGMPTGMPAGIPGL